MACGLHTKLDAAVAAAREAFDTAHENDTLSDSDLNLLFVYYQGIKKIREDLVHKEHEDVVLPDGDALDILPALKKKRPEMPVIVISANV